MHQGVAFSIGGKTNEHGFEGVRVEFGRTSLLLNMHERSTAESLDVAQGGVCIEDTEVGRLTFVGSGW